MKKSSLVGIEVYYEEKPVVKPPAAPTWKYGDAIYEEHLFSSSLADEEIDEEIEDNFDFSGRCEAADKDIEEITLAFEQVHSPVAGKIYKVRGLGLCAKYVADVYTPLSEGRIRTMKHHGVTFYIDGENMLFASDKEVNYYLEESD